MLRQWTVSPYQSSLSMEITGRSKMGICLFCQESGKLTKEHIFPNWLRNYIPRNTQHTRHVTSYVGQRSLSAGKVNRPGNIHSQRLRVVCASCNNGWMSELQSRAKPHLIPLIDGSWSKLDDTACKTLAAWTAMFCTVWEQADPRSAEIPVEHRKHLSKKSECPQDWHVWIARHHAQDQDPGMANHFGFKGFRSNTHYSIQTTGFTVGQLFIQAFMATPPAKEWDGIAEQFSRSFDVQKLHPAYETWPAARAMKAYSPQDAQRLSCFIANRMGAKSFVLN